MARPRKPTNVLTLTGAFKAHPERARARAEEPQAQGEIGPAPKHLSAKEKRCWAEVVNLCHPGTLCSADRLIVEHACRLLAALRQDRRYLDTKLQTRFEAVLGRLGLTPADRSKVAIKAPPGIRKNKFLSMKTAN